MDLSLDRALVGELAQQLQEAVQARTSLGVSLRLADARIKDLEEENAALKPAPE